MREREREREREKKRKSERERFKASMCFEKKAVIRVNQIVLIYHLTAPI